VVSGGNQHVTCVPYMAHRGSRNKK